MNTKAKFWLLALVIVAAGAYFFFNAQIPTPSPAAPAPATSTTKPAATSTYTPPPNVGAAGVSNPNAPAGSATECAKCSEYQGVQKAQCLVDLNCQ